MSARWPRTEKDHLNRPVSQLIGESILLIVRTLLWVGFTTAGMALNMWAAVVLLLMAPSGFWGYLAAAFAAAVTGGISGGVIGFGQVLTLRRWLDTPASLGSFFSTILASSSALISGTLLGWWVHGVAGDLVGAIAGVVIYGLVFGLVQRPMLEYMSHSPMLWVPVNAVAAVLGALSVLAVYDVSGGSREMLQFRYGGLVYSLIVGIAFLWMTRETRMTMSKQRWAMLEPGDASDASDASDAGDDLDEAPYSIDEAHDIWTEAAVLAMHEQHAQHVYRVFKVFRDPNTSPTVPKGNSAPSPGPEGEVKGTDVIDGTYRVLS